MYTGVSYVSTCFTEITDSVPLRIMEISVACPRSTFLYACFAYNSRFLALIASLFSLYLILRMALMSPPAFLYSSRYLSGSYPATVLFPSNLTAYSQSQCAWMCSACPFLSAFFDMYCHPLDAKVMQNEQVSPFGTQANCAPSRMAFFKVVSAPTSFTSLATVDGTFS